MDFFTPPRRTWLTEPDEHLLLPGMGSVPLHALVRGRLRAATADWGLDPTDVLATPLVSVPLPLYYEGGFGPGRRRWDGVRPEAMTHPLLWLPERLAQRYEMIFPDGTSRIESDAEYCVRVALEAEAAGLFDPAEGWVDVLALHDLDIGDPAVRDRVSRWLAGVDDPVLDSIDLSDWTERAGDPDWALAQTQVLVADLVAASWVIACEGLTTSLMNLVQADRTSTKFSAAHTALLGFARVASDWVGAAPLTGAGTTIEDTVNDVTGWANDLAASNPSLPELLDGPAVALLEAVDAVRSNPVLAESFDSLAEVAALAD